MAKGDTPTGSTCRSAPLAKPLPTRGPHMDLKPSFREDFQAYTLLDRAFSGDQGSQSIPCVLQYQPHSHHTKAILLDLLTKSPAPEDKPQQPSPISYLSLVYTHASTNSSKAQKIASDPVSQLTQRPPPPGVGGVLRPALLWATVPYPQQPMRMQKFRGQ